jgi:hypothetical protein
MIQIITDFLLYFYSLIKKKKKNQQGLCSSLTNRRSGTCSFSSVTDFFVGDGAERPRSPWAFLVMFCLDEWER